MSDDLLYYLVKKYNLLLADLEKKECDDDLFLTLTEKIESFSDTAPYFRLTDTEINEIEVNKNTERTRKRVMLVKWRNKNGSDATYLSIVKIFLRMNNRLLAEIVLKKLKQTEVKILKLICIA